MQETHQIDKDVYEKIRIKAMPLCVMFIIVF